MSFKPLILFLVVMTSLAGCGQFFTIVTGAPKPPRAAASPSSLPTGVEIEVQKIGEAENGKIEIFRNGDGDLFVRRNKGKFEFCGTTPRQCRAFIRQFLKDVNSEALDSPISFQSISTSAGPQTSGPLYPTLP